MQAIQRIDAQIVAPVRAEMDRRGQPYKMMVLPDHYTPVAARTHTLEPVPFVIYDSREEKRNPAAFDEGAAADSSLFFDDGYRLMERFIGKGSA